MSDEVFAGPDPFRCLVVLRARVGNRFLHRPPGDERAAGPATFLIAESRRESAEGGSPAPRESSQESTPPLMTVERRDPDEEVPRRPESERAVDLFARLLESSDDPLHPDRARFDELLQRNPGLRDELMRMWDGLEKFESIRTEIPRRSMASNPNVGSPWSTWKRVAGGIALAAAALAATVVLSIVSRHRDADPRFDEFRAALLGHCESFLHVAVGPLNEIDQRAQRANWKRAWQELHGSESATPPAFEDPAAIRSDAEYADSVAGLFTAATAIASSSTVASFATEWSERLSRYRDSLQGPSPSPCVRAVRERLDTGIPSRRRNPGFLFGISLDPALMMIAKQLSLLRNLPPDIEPFVEDFAKSATYSIHAIDLDDSGEKEIPARVFVQPVDFLTGAIGAAVDIGMTSSEPRFLIPGDWRITVADVGGKEMRFSELRILALPGQDLGRLVTFLRNTDEVSTGMAFREHCEALVGVSKDEVDPKQYAPELPQETTTVGDLSIDPYEVTCEQYSEFYRQASKHPDWFGGTFPVHLPEVLEADGSCLPDVSRMPIVDVTWEEAVLYANWAGKRLPTQREWERVARGTAKENRKYPWGPAFDAQCINDAHSQAKLIETEVKANGSYKPSIPPYRTLQGFSAFDPQFDAGATPATSGDPVFRLADNVSEYTEDLYVEGLATENPVYLQYGSIARVIKGGDWLIADWSNTMTHSRGAFLTNMSSTTTGFRCVKTPTPGFTIR
jgi:formylglycine-generating enzyme required for sulfatase activity